VYEVTIDLYKDWIHTIKDYFKMKGQPLPEDLSADEMSLRYFEQHASSEEAKVLSKQNKERFQTLEQQILQNLEAIIVPDIRKRTGYQGHELKFSWVYNQGEHIIEHCSEYRIPL
jgi:hypothetical protein